MRGTAVSASLRLDKIEVALRFGFAQIGHETLVDAVCIHDDLAFGRLAKYLGQANNRYGSARDHVGQHLARSDRRQLIDITDHEQG